jgi:hypothetical protein
VDSDLERLAVGRLRPLHPTPDLASMTVTVDPVADDIGTNGVHASGTTRQSAETASEQAAKLNARYDILHLCFEFLLSALILLGGYLILVVYHDPSVSSGVVAVSTLVISYWFGKSRSTGR